VAEYQVVNLDPIGACHQERIEVVSQPRITPEGKAQADSKAQHTRQYVRISRGLQRGHRASGGVVKPLPMIFRLKG